MTALINLIWFVFGGFLLGIAWYIIGLFFYITIIGIPLGSVCFEFAKLSMFPFGKEVIRETELKGKQNVSSLKKVFHVIINIIWIPIGIIFTLAYLVLGIISFITIIGIPIGIVYVRMGQFLLFPVGARVVSKKQSYASAVAEEIERRHN
ncbi:MAG: YccF domain-containing protein [Sphaerochaetaceae bacterium]|nr:hypothetical protein [Sphaerochaetaceae bacterium]MDC7236649.1 YccF domain-containing protein [Sphaerochaetaceae bacterium]MDC7249440.1 YccF domain-containing protein [Sphaerochaetaceae bacterium]